MIPFIGNSHEKQDYRDTKQIGGFLSREWEWGLTISEHKGDLGVMDMF